jgi:acyl dehydratase
MALDPAYAGYSYPASTPYLVGREKIREFAEAIGSVDAVHFDPEAAKALGYPDVIAPPTFPIVLTNDQLNLLIADENLGLDFSRVVHGDQRYTYIRPIRAGDALTCLCTISEITARAGAEFLTTSTAITTVEGELVATAVSRIVVRAAAPESEN